jgi:thymidylate kinase
MPKLICILGVDGSGKSTLIDGITANLNVQNKNYCYVHLYPKLENIGYNKILRSKIPTLPSKVAKYNKMLSFVKFIWVVSVTYFFILKQRFVNNNDYIFFDRYLYDFILSPERCGISNIGSFQAVLSKIIPTCDKILILGGDAQKIVNRKPELSILKIEEIQKKQLKLFRGFNNCYFIDTVKLNEAECRKLTMTLITSE